MHLSGQIKTNATINDTTLGEIGTRAVSIILHAMESLCKRLLSAHCLNGIQVPLKHGLLFNMPNQSSFMSGRGVA